MYLVANVQQVCVPCGECLEGNINLWRMFSGYMYLVVNVQRVYSSAVTMIFADPADVTVVDEPSVYTGLDLIQHLLPTPTEKDTKELYVWYSKQEGHAVLESYTVECCF